MDYKENQKSNANEVKMRSKNILFLEILG